MNSAIHLAPAPAALAPWIEALFLVAGISDDCVGVRLPKSAAELVVALDGHYEIVAGPHDVGATFDSAWMSGVATGPLHLRTTGRSRLAGVRFTAWGARAFVDGPQHALRDRAVRLEDVWGHDASASLCHAVRHAPTPEAAMAALEAALLARLPASHPPAAVVDACRALQMSHGRETVRTLATCAGVSEQRLRTLFLEHVGVSPKTLARLIAHDQAIVLLNDLPWGQLGGAAHTLGFADQSHFIRDFSRLSGLTPGAYLALRGAPGVRNPFAHFLQLTPESAPTIRRATTPRRSQRRPPDTPRPDVAATRG